MCDNNKRLDVLLYELSGYGRQFCKHMILNGDVLVDGKIITKPGIKVKTLSIITYKEPKIKYVSRGGYKLEKALETFCIDVKNLVCVDVGASTGGFTDCLLQNNAAKVYAIDSGTDQLHKDISGNVKVISLEKTNIKYIERNLIKELADIAVIDVSFISLTKVLQPLKVLLKDNAEIIALIKPQFEMGKKIEIRKGVVKDKKMHLQILKNIYDCVISLDMVIKKITYSPLKGSDGNREYLVLISLNKNDRNINIADLEQVVEEVFNNI